MTDEPLDPLSQLALRHGTDKYGEHLYTADYHRLFADLRDRPLRLLEIGVGGYGQVNAGGCGLRMWADYFPNARIVGLDLHPKRLDLPARVTIRQGSQSDIAVLDRLWADDGPFDIVIDDGSHVVSDVLATFHHLYPRLSEGGVYVVEDTQTAFWPEFGGSRLGRGTIFELADHLVLGMHRLEMEVTGLVRAALPYGDITRAVRFLRNLIVFERGRNSYPSNYHLRLDHPDVAAMLARLDAAARDTSSPGPWLIRAGIEMRAGLPGEAAMTAARGLAAFPGNGDLLAMLGRAAGAAPAPATSQVAAPANPPAEDGFWAASGRNAAAAALTAPPRLAVMVCAYRRPDLLPVLLHALQAQTLRNFLVVVMHDGGDDAMLALLRRVTDGLDIPVEYRFSARRHNDYGHSLRDRGIQECQSEHLLLTNDDNYYVPVFVETMFAAIDADGLDLVLCDMVHSHANAGGRQVPPYSPFATLPKKLSVDIGCFVVRTSAAKLVGFRDRSHDGDGTFVEDLMVLRNTRLRWAKVDRTLFVHN